MNDEKREFTRWWLLILALAVVTTAVFTYLGYFGSVASTVVERKVFEESYQRKESYKERLATLEASLVELKSRRSNPNLKPETIAEIDTQITVITARINAARSQQ